LDFSREAFTCALPSVAMKHRSNSPRRAEGSVCTLSGRRVASVAFDPLDSDLLNHAINKETIMSGMIITAHVKDPARWEKNFRSHSDLLKQGHVSLVHYTITKNNDVVMYSESDDDDTAAAVRFMESPEVAKAMAEDGVDRETVKVYPLDKDFQPS
jgi:hypothetical protein